MNNNTFKPDKDGQVEIPFHAHASVWVDWTSELTYDELYEAAVEKIRELDADWEIDDEHLSNLQPDGDANER